MSDLAALRLDHFAGNVGKAFELSTATGELSLTLESAEPLGHALREGGAFRLTFRGPSEPVLPQAIYSLRHETEAHEIFIVPIALDGRGVEYEAIFT